jgi:capsular polysaccharide transport system permease protein
VRMQLRVLSALMLRETRVTFGTSQLGYLWAIVTPAAGTAALAAIYSLAGRHPPFGESLALFFATGILTLELFSKLGASLMTALEANAALLNYPPVRRLDVLFARALLIGATYAAIMAIFLVGLIALDLARWPWAPETVVLAFSVTFLLGLGYGIASAVILHFWQSWRHVEKILTRPLFFVSGIFYVPGFLPPAARDWLWWNPVLHCVEWMRCGFYPLYHSAVLDRGYVVGWALALVLLGLAGTRLGLERQALQ